MGEMTGRQYERFTMRMTSPLRGYALAVVAPLLWAGNFVIGRALAEVDPFVLNYARWLVAGICLLPILIIKAHDVLHALRERGASLLVLSVLGVVGFNTLLYTGLEKTDAGLAGVIFGLTPLFINVLSGIWGQQPVSRRTWVGTGIAFAGVVFILGNRGYDGVSDGTGPLFVFLSSFVFALYTVGLKSLNIPLRPDASLAVTVWLGLMIMTPFAVNQTSAWQVVFQAPGALPAIAYLGIGASVLAFYAWQTGVQIHGAQRTGAFLQLIPVFGVLFGILFLNETASGSKLLGLAIVVTGVFFAQSERISR